MIPINTQKIFLNNLLFGSNIELKNRHLHFNQAKKVDIDIEKVDINNKKVNIIILVS